MNLIRITTHLSFWTILVAHMFTGVFVMIIGKVLQVFIRMHSDGETLPILTQYVTPYATSIAPVVIGFILGSLLTALLFFLEKSPRAQPHMPFFITLAWIPCLIHLTLVFLGMFVPFITFFGIKSW
jgi:hypothetical protein